MTDPPDRRHQQVTDRFLEAVGLPAPDLEACLFELRARDPALCADVESLLLHDRDDTLLEGAIGPRVAPTLAPASSDSSLRTGRLHSRFLGGRRRRIVWALAAAVALTVLGAWTHTRIQSALLEVRSGELENLLAASERSLSVWIENEGRLARRWASDPRVEVQARPLLARAAAGADQNALVYAPEKAALDSLLAVDTRRSDVNGMGVIDDRGIVVYTTLPTPPGPGEATGRRVTGHGFGFVSRALDGETVFDPPTTVPEWFPMDIQGTMYAYLLTPLGPGGGDGAGRLRGGVRAGRDLHPGHRVQPPGPDRRDLRLRSEGPDAHPQPLRGRAAQPRAHPGGRHPGRAGVAAHVRPERAGP